MTKETENTGFTLVELLVVISIISLLILMIVPSIARARALAKRATCASNVGSIGKALKLYGGEFNDSYPWICGDGSGIKGYLAGMVVAHETEVNVDSSAGSIDTGTLHSEPL